MNIYVGNLLQEATEEDLRHVFEAFGQVGSVKIIKDQYAGDSRGFGFVEIPNGLEAQSAISGLDGKDLKGRTLKVSEARPRSYDRGGGLGGEDASEKRFSDIQNHNQFFHYSIFRGCLAWPFAPKKS